MAVLVILAWVIFWAFDLKKWIASDVSSFWPKIVTARKTFDRVLVTVQKLSCKGLADELVHSWSNRSSFLSFAAEVADVSISTFMNDSFSNRENVRWISTCCGGAANSGLRVDEIKSA
jgi:hypothetical protein